MDDTTASFMRKAGIAAFEDNDKILRLPEFASVNQGTQLAVMKRAGISPDQQICTLCYNPPGGVWTEETTFTSGDMYGANGLPDGVWVLATTTYSYQSNFTPNGGQPIEGPLYYPSPPLPKATTCTLAATAIISTVASAAQTILANPAAFGATVARAGFAGVTAAGAAAAYLEAGTATVAGALALTVELLALMTPVGWAALIAAVAGLVTIAVMAYQCKNGE
jgi:hypothetical protein